MHADSGFIESDQVRQRKTDRHARDLSQAWSAAHGDPNAKPVGNPGFKTGKRGDMAKTPWDVDASDGEGDSDGEEGPVALVSWANERVRQPFFTRLHSAGCPSPSLWHTNLTFVVRVGQQNDIALPMAR